MSRFAVPALAGFLAIGSLVVAQPVRTQSAGFDVALNGKTVGTASYEHVATPEGYRSTSIVRVGMQGLDYSLSKSEQLSPAREFEHVRLNAVVNQDAVTIVGAPEPGQIVLNISASGRKTTMRLPAHSGAIFIPDFDPGALQTLLAIAAQRNNRDLWAIIPRKQGSVEPIQLATYQDEQGTLGGQPIMVHHLVATIADTKTDLFSGPDDRLLQAELPQQGFSLVRTGFLLKPPKRAPAPPAQ